MKRDCLGKSWRSLLPLGFSFFLAFSFESLVQNQEGSWHQLNKYFNRDLSESLYTKLKKLNDELLAKKLTAVEQSDRDRDIWIIRADGKSDPFPLTIDNEWDDDMPNWSPDDKQIAYVSSRSHAQKIWLMNKDGTGKIQLTKGMSNDEAPLWSPDGSLVAFIRNDNLFTIEVSSGTEQELTRAFKVERLCAWARDGKSLLLVLQEENRKMQLLEIDLNSKNIAAVALQPSLYTLWVNLHLCPSNDQVVFEDYNLDNYEIAIKNLVNDKQWYLTDSFSHDRHPAWSAKGDLIAFSSNRKTPTMKDLGW